MNESLAQVMREKLREKFPSTRKGEGGIAYKEALGHVLKVTGVPIDTMVLHRVISGKTVPHASMLFVFSRAFRIPMRRLMNTVDVQNKSLSSADKS